MDYDSYNFLKFERPSDGVLLITINRPEKLNATNRALHGQLAEITGCKILAMIRDARSFF